MIDIGEIIDFDAFPLDQPNSAQYGELVAECRHQLANDGMFNLEGLLRPGLAAEAVAEIRPTMDTASFTHKRAHNIYFANEIAGLAPDHPALALQETINHTVCGDQIPGAIVMQVYEYPLLATFLAKVMEKDQLHTMADPLARVNVMAYGDGEALNWHFDRSEFTTTLLLQAADGGGAFQYRTGLRSDDDPSYDGVAALLRGEDADVRTLSLTPGTLNVFRGINTAHRVTPVEGGKQRMIAVFSYYENPGVWFSDEERIGFFGRAA